MVRKKEIQTSNDERVLVYLLDALADGGMRVGNSYECPQSEAVLLIQQRKAKSDRAPIGEIPSDWTVIEAEAEEENGGN